MKYILVAITAVTILACMGGAHTGNDLDTLIDSFDTSETDDRSWHERYIEDSCARCPECCVTSLWDSTEAELDYEESGCGEGDAEHCEDCPGPDCICVEVHPGTWVVNATIGDTEYEDFGRYDDSSWPDQWTPPDDEAQE